MDYKHPNYWTKEKHYGAHGQCGQSCPCCRAEVGDTFGACPICILRFNETIQMVNDIDNNCDNKCNNKCCKRKRKFTKNNGSNSKKQKK